MFEYVQFYPQALDDRPHSLLRCDRNKKNCRSYADEGTVHTLNYSSHLLSRTKWIFFGWIFFSRFGHRCTCMHSVAYFIELQQQHWWWCVSSVFERIIKQSVPWRKIAAWMQILIEFLALCIRRGKIMAMNAYMYLHRLSALGNLRNLPFASF